MLPHPARDQIDEDPAQLTGGEDGGVDDGAGPVAHRRKELALPAPMASASVEPSFMSAVQAARLFIALDDDLGRGLDIINGILQMHLIELLQRLKQGVEGHAGPRTSVTSATFSYRPFVARHSWANCGIISAGILSTQ